VSVSILLVMTIVMAALGVRYLAVKEARRGDAYNAAGRLGEMMLEGWRSAGAPNTYDPVARFAGQTVITISTATLAPPAPSGFTTLGRYQVVLDHVNYFVTLAYINEDLMAQRPAVLNATVGFQHNYQAASVATSGNYARLTTYK
jgi:hypothetical protein